jgi:DNA-binding MarR family transcriptional regulator
VADPRLTFTLHHLVAVLDRHADAILRRELGMTYSQFLFLVTLDGAEGVDGTTLARHLDVSRAAVSKRLPWFTDRALVEVRDDPHHGRRTRLFLTDAGRTLARTAADTLEDALQAPARSDLDVDLDALHRDLDALLAWLRAGLEAGTHDAPGADAPDDA